jgi:hypothetical protein
MTTKQYLNQYKKLKTQIERDRERIAQIEASLNKSLELDGMPHGTKASDPTADVAVRLADIRDRLKRRILEAELIRQTIAEEIEQIETPAYKELLYERYLVYPALTWEAVTDRVSEGRRDRYESKHVMGYMHGQALKEFERMRKEGE